MWDDRRFLTGPKRLASQLLHATPGYLNREPVATLMFTDAVPPSFIAFIRYVPVRDAQLVVLKVTQKES